MSLSEKIEKMESLLKAITEQNRITGEFLKQNDILKAKESAKNADELINEFNRVMFF